MKCTFNVYTVGRPFAANRKILVSLKPEIDTRRRIWQRNIRARLNGGAVRAEGGKGRLRSRTRRGLDDERQ